MLSCCGAVQSSLFVLFCFASTKMISSVAKYVPRIFSQLFKWSFFVISRFALYELPEYFFGESIFDIPNKNFGTIFRHIGHHVVDYFSGSMILWASPLVGDVIFQRVLKKRKKSKEVRLAYKEEHAILMLRHLHLPFDIFASLYQVATLRERLVPIIVLKPILVFDFDEIDDPAWPYCSFLHMVWLYTCPKKCRDGNRIEIRRTSLQSLRSETVRSWPLNDVFASGASDRIYLVACQSRGLIFVYFKRWAKIRPIFLDIYDTRTDRVIHVDTNIFPRTWMPRYFFCDSDSISRDRQSIRFRMVFRIRSQGVAFFGIGQCVVELSIDNSQVANVSNVRLFSFHAMGRLVKSYLQRSSEKIGMVLHFVDGVQRFIFVYDSTDQVLKRVGFWKIFAEDEPWRRLVARYMSNFKGATDLPVAVVLTSAEAIGVQRNWSIWRTYFRPPTLKHIVLKPFFEHFGNKIENFNANQCRRMTGVDLDSRIF